MRFIKVLATIGMVLCTGCVILFMIGASIANVRANPQIVDGKPVAEAPPSEEKWIYSVTINAYEKAGMVTYHVKSLNAQGGQPPLSKNALVHIGLWLAAFGTDMPKEPIAVPAEVIKLRRENEVLKAAVEGLKNVKPCPQPPRPPGYSIPVRPILPVPSE